jgi:hypothetical protein
MFFYLIDSKIKAKRETGERPVRTHHCMSGQRSEYHCHWREGALEDET